ncbi:MAG: hypothetical protein ABI472_05510 [Ginsengibacter sp.]
MESLVPSLITLVIGGFLGGLVKSLLDYRNQVFSQLWDKRLKAYTELWKIMGQFPLWPALDDVTYIKLFEMSKSMRDWYFGSGGILMSHETRTLYGDLQEDINARILKDKKNDENLVRKDEYDTVQKLCSLLRNGMTNDLLSRKKLL